MKYSLAILKPDCLQRRLSEKVIRILKDNEFQIILMKQLRLSKGDVEYVWRDCLSEDWFASFAEFMMSFDSLILVVKHDEGDAIAKLNELVGSADPQKSDFSKVRSTGESIRRNLIHSTKNEKTFWYELPYFFSTRKS